MLDEPTMGLDPVLRVDLWVQFTDLADVDATLLVSSHVMDEADHHGDLIIIVMGVALMSLYLSAAKRKRQTP